MVEHIAIMSLVCCGIYLLGEPKMILHGLKERTRKLFTYQTTHSIQVGSGYKTEKQDNEMKFYWPIWGCVMCMASVWGTLVYLAGICWLGWEWHVIDYILSVIGCAFLNGLLWFHYEHS